MRWPALYIPLHSRWWLVVGSDRRTQSRCVQLPPRDLSHLRRCGGILGMAPAFRFHKIAACVRGRTMLPPVLQSSSTEACFRGLQSYLAVESARSKLRAINLDLQFWIRPDRHSNLRLSSRCNALIPRSPLAFSTTSGCIGNCLRHRASRQRNI